jgi:hypothetical protein
VVSREAIIRREDELSFKGSAQFPANCSTDLSPNHSISQFFIQLTTDSRQTFAYNQAMTDERERLTAMVKAAG